jgi:glutamine---fructose-6-phosphate transaminase (isomerizing)
LWSGSSCSGWGRPGTRPRRWRDWAHVDVYLAKTLDYRVLLLPGSRWDGQAMEWLVKRGSTVLPVGAEVDGAGPAIRYRHDGDPLVRLLTEVTWWS